MYAIFFKLHFFFKKIMHVVDVGGHILSVILCL
jgi:hypothetical protein